MNAESVVRWTVRIALALYVVALLLRSRRRPGNETTARLLYTTGCAFFLAHLIAAFHFAHDWSHADALAETALQTKELVGWNSGLGLYLNYLFAAVWLFDAAWWNLSPKSYTTRLKPIDYLVHGFLGFIAVNATVIFETGPTRWIGVAACVALLVAARRGRSH